MEHYSKLFNNVRDIRVHRDNHVHHDNLRGIRDVRDRDIRGERRLGLFEIFQRKSHIIQLCM